MSMTKDKHSVLRDLSPQLPPWALRSSLLAIAWPAMLHFQRNELFMAYGLCLFMLLRVGYHFDEIVRGGRPFYLSPQLFNMIYFANLWTLLGGLFYQGYHFRYDISSLVIGLYLMGKLACYTFVVHLSPKSTWGNSRSFMCWDFTVVLGLLANLFIRDVSHPIVLVDFVKGAFWGALLQNINNRGFLNSQYPLWNYMFCLWEGCGANQWCFTQMAPVKVHARGVCSCDREDYECADPDDDDDDDGEDCNAPKQHEL